MRSAVAVKPDCQRQGVGAALMRWAEDEARRGGCARIEVGVRVALDGNLAFYRALGFDVTGESRHDGYAYTTYLDLRKVLRAE